MKYSYELQVRSSFRQSLADFALGALVQADEARYIQDNKEGKLPRFLKEAGFAVQELLPRYRGVRFLLATKDAGVQERGKV